MIGGWAGGLRRGDAPNLLSHYHRPVREAWEGVTGGGREGLINTGGGEIEAGGTGER